ncbi:MAG TPA: DinB family protein [Herpetosiphonaceae bacterium]|nr:DinB family protein [Herpetosiphonaceae bacterium]
MTTPAERNVLIEKIKRLPAQLELLVGGLSYAELHTRFLPEEWTVAQNVHHLADSHMNCLIRIKLILTEEHPTLRPYDQDAWALTPDYAHTPISESLTLLRGLHSRWAILFEQLSEKQWQRTGFHPENGVVTLDGLLRDYAAHGEGHLDQITRTLAAK